MRVGNDWADEHWDIVALMMALTMALAFAVSMAVAFNALTTRRDEPTMVPSISAPGAVDDARATLDRDTP